MDLGEGVSGPKAKRSQKSLEKSLPGRAPKVRKKSRKRSEKSTKSLKMGFGGLFGPFLRLLSDFWGPRPGDFFRDFFRDFFETFWLLAPRLLLPGRRNLNHGVIDPLFQTGASAQELQVLRAQGTLRRPFADLSADLSANLSANPSPSSSFRGPQ